MLILIENYKKITNSKLNCPTGLNYPKAQILFYKNCPPYDFIRRTLVLGPTYWIYYFKDCILNCKGLSQVGRGVSVFGRKVNPISTRGADYAHHSTTYEPPDLQALRRPCKPNIENFYLQLSFQVVLDVVQHQFDTWFSWNLRRNVWIRWYRLRFEACLQWKVAF